MTQYVDLMQVDRDVYHCANWCDDGVTSIRGNFCPKCSWDDMFACVSAGYQDSRVRTEVYQAEVFDKVGLHLL